MQVTGGSHNQYPVKGKSRAARNSQSQSVVAAFHSRLGRIGKAATGQGLTRLWPEAAITNYFWPRYCLNLKAKKNLNI